MSWQHFVTLMHREPDSGIVSSSLPRLILAAILGALTGFQRELNDAAAGRRSNMFIGCGGALFTVLSRGLAAGPGHHIRGLATGLTSAATLLLAASVGMAAGGGLCRAAIVGTGNPGRPIHLQCEVAGRSRAQKQWPEQLPASSLLESAVCRGPVERA